MMNTKVIAEEGDAATVRLDPVDLSVNRNVETPVCCIVCSNCGLNTNRAASFCCCCVSCLQNGWRTCFSMVLCFAVRRLVAPDSRTLLPFGVRYVDDVRLFLLLTVSRQSFMVELRNRAKSVLESKGMSTMRFVTAKCPPPTVCDLQSLLFPRLRSFTFSHGCLVFSLFMSRLFFVWLIIVLVFVFRCPVCF